VCQKGRSKSQNIDDEVKKKDVKKDVKESESGERGG